MSVAEIPVVTIDGPSGSGKGTIAGMLARKLGWKLLDSGALYRLLALAAQNRQIEFADERALEALARRLDVQFIAGSGDQEQRIMLDGMEVTQAIRNEQIGAGASQVAAVLVVRAALLERQQAFRELPGLIADGRDMGTVVFPDALLKVFLTASAEERARRRYLQLKAKGDNANLASLVEDINERDRRDMQRSIAPLKPAEGAVLLDSTDLSVDQVLERILEKLHTVISPNNALRV